MKCANCLANSATKTFDAVPCCEDCFELAQASCRRADSQMKALLILHRDVVRAMMMQGKLRVSNAENLKCGLSGVPPEMSRVPQGTETRPGPQSEPR